ncbi:dynein regulatory complex subunit 4 [Oryzias melastigma]|uniref:Dynein regulatory complex subunit 4 n=2 Tax=Oryzias melastigma TaxID=30732 RepID=A0A3B3BZA1_ORYME|nr:dynein regulatory complex subunit 4 [Oryzias melastigma]
MAPKAKTKKARKGKTSTVMEAPSNNELSKDQLWEEGLLRLQEELDRVREEKRNFQLERDKYQSAWEISKEELEDTEARVRFKRRQTEEGRERHRAEISDYQQRLKNMLAEQSNSVSDLKKLNVSSSLLLRNQITEREVELCKEYERLQAACRERKFLKETSVRNLELKHQEELMKMSRHYERQLRDVADTFEVRRKNLLQRKQTQIQSKISSLDKAIKARLDSLITDNLKKLGELQLAWDKEEEEEDPPSFEQQNKPLPKRKPPLRRKLLLEEKTEPEVQEKQFELQEPQQKHRLKDLMTRRRSRQKEIDKELREEMVKNEFLLQACIQLEQECSDLRRRGTESVLDIQQRSSVEEMRLQRRVAEMSEAVERTEVKLLSVLALTNTNQETRNDAAKRLQEIFESKQAQMDSMKQTLEGDCKEYDELLQTRKDKLRAAGVHSFPFKSAKTILKAAKPLPDILQATGCSTFNAHKQVM